MAFFMHIQSALNHEFAMLCFSLFPDHVQKKAHGGYPNGAETPLAPRAHARAQG
jgi:hypothetical protein